MMNKTNNNWINPFILGLTVGYCIRHFFPPKEVSTWEWVVSGIIVVIGISILVYINLPHKDKVRNKK